MALPARRVCSDTGLDLVAAAAHPRAWRVAKERYVRSGGITAVLENSMIGPLPSGARDRRGRFDTVGRTVYFARSPETAFAEVLQPFRKARLAVRADAEAVGMTEQQYIEAVLAGADANGITRPWAISGDWLMAHCIHEVAMPQKGWWVDIAGKNTVNVASLNLAEPLGELGVPMLHLGDLMSEDRAITTIVAQYLRNQTLDDGTEPLGIVFQSKTGYGTCYAWWNRRDDLGLTPGSNDPRTIQDLNCEGPSLRAVATDWGLDIRN